MLAGTIPVVFGADRLDYEKVAPPRSFIHIADFDTLEELANYLKYLIANPEAYK